MKNRLLLLFFLIVILFSGFTSSAQAWLWGQQGSTSLKADVFASNVATNRTGNVYQTGGFETRITFGTTTLSSLANADAFLVKYDQNGNLLWARQSIGDDRSSAVGYSVATDDSDNSYITGYAQTIPGSIDTLTFGSQTLHLLGTAQFFLVKYDSNGNVVWAKQPDSTIASGTEGWSVATDKFGHEYVTGDGAFLIKYDRNGNVIWTVPQTNGSSRYTTGCSVTTDISGNIYMSGVLTDSLQFGTYQLYSANGEIFTAKFDSNGKALWAQQSTNDSDYFYRYGRPSVAIEKSGAAYITGVFSDTITFGSYTFTSIDKTGSFFIVKYNPNGTIAWGKQANAVNGSSWVSNSVCTDDLNHVYISGAEEAVNPASFIFANDTVSNARTTSDNPSFLLKLDTSGNVICSSILYGGGIGSNSVASDSTGKFVYIGGGFFISFAIGPDSLINHSGGYDTYTGRWQSCSSCALAINITPQSPLFCAGQGVTLYANGGKNYTWSPATGLSATTGNSVVANPGVTTTYYITEKDSLGCFGVNSDVVTVKPNPLANFNFTLNSNQATFNSAGSSSDVTSYSWNFGDNTTSAQANPVHNFSAKDTFNVCLTVYNGSNCSYTLCKTVDLLSEGINNIASQNSIQLYPNPATKEFAISNLQFSSEIEILDMLGRTLLVQKSDNNLTTIDVSSLAAGIYLVEIKSQQGMAVKKFVKE